MYMERTTILLPPDLKIKAEKYAQKRGISLGELIRNSLENSLLKKDSKEEDPFFTDRAVFSDHAPKDLADNHDEYLYGSNK